MEFKTVFISAPVAAAAMEPTAIPDESPAAGIRAIADRLGLRVHNLNIYLVTSNPRVELDLELPDSLSLLEATSIQRNLKKR